jgi:hypothetical protein
LNAGLVLGVLLLLVGLAWFLKRRLILPRSGVVKFGQSTKREIRNAHILTWGLVLATFAVLILSANRLITEPTWENLPRWFTDFDLDLVFALVIFAFFAMIAYSMGLPRFYLHGLLLAVGNFTSTVLLVYNEVQFGWPLALAGGIIAIIGAAVLFRFLQQHPLPEMEASNAC